MACLYVYLSLLTIATAAIAQKTEPPGNKSVSNIAHNVTVKAVSSISSQEKTSPKEDGQINTLKTEQIKPSNNSTISASQNSTIEAEQVEPSNNSSISADQNSTIKTEQFKPSNSSSISAGLNSTIEAEQFKPSNNSSISGRTYISNTTGQVKPSARSIESVTKGKAKPPVKRNNKVKRRQFKRPDWRSKRIKKGKDATKTQQFQAALHQAVVLFTQEYSKKQGRLFFYESMNQVVASCTSSQKRCMKGSFKITLVGRGRQDNQMIKSTVKKGNQTINGVVKKDSQTLSRAVKKDYRFASVVQCRGVEFEIGYWEYPDVTTRIVNQGKCKESINPYVLAALAAKEYAATYDRKVKAIMLYVSKAKDITFSGIVGNTWLSFSVKLALRLKDGTLSLVECKDIVCVIPLENKDGVDFKSRGKCKNAKLHPWDMNIFKLMSIIRA